MIIFYSKTTGEIIGNIEGRIHSNQQLKMWIGEGTERIVCNWTKNENDQYTPELDQKEIWQDLDANSQATKNYKVDITTLKLYAK